MDKELPKSELHNMIANVHIGTNESFLPGINVQKASVMFRDTIDLDELADRAKKDGTPYSKESLTGCFRTMINEIYKATEAGFNVDFGLARTELTVNEHSIMHMPNSTLNAIPSSPAFAPLPA